MRQVFFIAIALIAFVASADEPDAKPRDVPLSSIVTTSPQRGMIETTAAFPQKESDRNSVSISGYLRQILQSAKSGLSNVFLVDATSPHDAVRASFSALVGARPTETPVPVNTPDPIRGSHWLVAYLGSGPSEPVQWKVMSVTVHQNRIRLTYRRPAPSPTTSDVHSYYFWIPLGTLAPGAYEIELYDAESSVVTLMRRVTVKKEAVK